MSKIQLYNGDCLEVMKKIANWKGVNNMCPELIREWKSRQGSEDYRKASPVMRACLVKAVNEDTETGRCLLALIENGIAAINAHTNLDCAPGGVNDCLAKVLRLSDIQVMNPVGTDENGRPYGLLRQGITNVQQLEDFLAHVKTSLGCEGMRYVNSRKPVHKIAVGGGACAGALEEVVKAGCDTFVTADAKYNQFRDAFDLGLNLIDAGHFHTEAPVIAALAEKISGAFPDIQVKISEKHGDVMKFC
mgnify:CR=1 FL=1